MGYGGVHNTQGNSGEVGVFLCSKIGNGMDIFWNYIIWVSSIPKICVTKDTEWSVLCIKLENKVSTTQVGQSKMRVKGEVWEVVQEGDE